MPWYVWSVAGAWVSLCLACRWWWRALGEQDRMWAVAVPAGRNPPAHEPLGPLRPLLLRLSRFGDTYLARFGPAIRDQLRRAGQPLGLSEREWVGLKCGAALVALGLGWLAAMAGLVGLPAFLLVTAAGYYGPDLWLRSRAAARQTELAAAVPGFMDAVATCLAAGIPLDVALEKVAAAMGGPLGAEWELALEEIRLHVPPATAYRRLAERNPCDAVRLLVQSITQADTLGTGCAGVLRQQAQILRLQSRERAREQAARAGPKIAAITTFIVTPVTFAFVVTLTILALLTGRLVSLDLF